MRDIIAAGAHGMESIDPVNFADVKKGFSRPAEYTSVLKRLAERNIHAITSFIIGMAEQILEQIRTWPPGLPVRPAHTVPFYTAG